MERRGSGFQWGAGEEGEGGRMCWLRTSGFASSSLMMWGGGRPWNINSYGLEKTTWKHWWREKIFKPSQFASGVFYSRKKKSDHFHCWAKEGLKVKRKLNSAPFSLKKASELALRRIRERTQHTLSLLFLPDFLRAFYWNKQTKFSSQEDLFSPKKNRTFKFSKRAIAD